MNHRTIRRRLNELEKELQAEQESSESSGQLLESLRQLEEAYQELRSRPGYNVSWELEIAQEMVKKLVEEGLL